MGVVAVKYCVLQLLALLSVAAAHECWNTTKGYSYNYPTAHTHYRTLRVEAPLGARFHVVRGVHTNGQIDIHTDLFHTPQQTHAQVREVVSQTSQGPVLTIVATSGEPAVANAAPPPPPVLAAGCGLHSLLGFLLLAAAAAHTRSVKHPLVALLAASLLVHTALSVCPAAEVQAVLPANARPDGTPCVTHSVQQQAGVRVLTVRDACVDREITVGGCRVRGAALPACGLPLELELSVRAAQRFVQPDGCVADPFRLVKANVIFQQQGADAVTYATGDAFQPTHCGPAASPAAPLAAPPGSPLAGVAVAGPPPAWQLLQLPLSLPQGRFEVSAEVHNAKGTVQRLECASAFEHKLPASAVGPRAPRLCFGPGCRAFDSPTDFVHSASMASEATVQGAVQLSHSACQQTVQIGLSSNPFCATLDVLPLTDAATLQPSSPAEPGVVEFAKPFAVAAKAAKRRRAREGGPPGVALARGRGYYAFVRVSNGLGEVARCFKQAFVLA